MGVSDQGSREVHQRTGGNDGFQENAYRLQSAKMCQAAGGTYSGNTCNPGTPNARTATQMCQAHGGTYITALDMCEIEGTK